MSINANCQRCRQPLVPASLPAFPPPPPPSSRPDRLGPLPPQRAHPHPHPQPQAHQRHAGTNAAVLDSVAALSPSAYDFLSASDRFTAAPPPPVPLAPYPHMYQRARTPAQPQHQHAITRIVVPPPPQNQQRRSLGPQDSYIVLSDSVLTPPPPPRQTATSPNPGPVTPATAAAVAATDPPPSAENDNDNDGNSISSNNNNSLQAHLAQLSNLYALLSSPPTSPSGAGAGAGAGSGTGTGGTGFAHPLCTECTELLFELMTRQLDSLKRERDRLLAFEKDLHKKRDDVAKQLSLSNPANKPPTTEAETDKLIKEALERDIAKLRKAEAHAVAELKAVEAHKSNLAADRAALDAEEADLAREEAEFWKQHTRYLVRRDELQDREDSLRTRLAHGRRELEKLQRTNVYNDAFCIGQEAGFGTINGLRLGRLPGVNVEWPEINAAWGHTVLLLSTIATKFGFHHFRGYRLVPCGSFSTIEKLGGGAAEDSAMTAGAEDEALGLADGRRNASSTRRVGGAGGGGDALGAPEGQQVVAVYELYGSGDFAVTRLLQNRRFDMAMVAFLECLRQLVEFVTARDPKVRVPHAVVKDRIGDVSIKLQFGSDEAWTRALRHVLLDLKILLSRASL